jgi:hypothetical protein
MSSILSSLVPKQTTDNCVDSLPVNCGDGVNSTKIDSAYKIEFPRSQTILPLAGGSVVSFGASNLKLSSSINVSNILTKNLSSLQGLNLQNKIEDLVKSRVLVNNALFDIARRNLKVVDDKQNKLRAPSIYLSIYNGEDSSTIKDGIFSPEMNRVCEFRFIPVEAFSKILDNLLDSVSFADIVGVSGRTYGDLKTLANDLNNKIVQSSSTLLNVELPSFPLIGGNEPNIVDLILEFFPIVNLNEDVLGGQNTTPSIGGYYTIMDGRIYIKMPDMSGRNSAGMGSSVISSQSSLWFEFLIESTISRLEISSFKQAPLANFVGDQQHEFPKLSNLDIVFELAEDESVRVYLSPVVKNQKASKRRTISSFGNTIELFSVPVLTKPIQSTENRTATINENSSPAISDLNYYRNKVDLYYPGFSSSSDSLVDNGFPFFGQKDANVIFGEANRPEMILSNNGENLPENDSRYFNISSYGVLEILNSTRPKFYEITPSKWISTIPSKNQDGNYVATFNFNDFSDLNIQDLDGAIEYIAYVGDSLGQITRISGPNIVLEDATPSITKINPNGFVGSIPIIIADPVVIEILGEDLGNAKQVKLVNSDTGSIFIFVPGDGVMSEPTNSAILLDFSNRSMESFGLLANQSYIVTIQGSGSNIISSEDSIYLVSNFNDERPIKGNLITKFQDGEVSSAVFGTKPIVGIPLFKNGQSATISIKSKSKIFKDGSDVFAYLALPESNSANEILSKVSFPENIGVITTSVGRLLLPLNIEYKLSSSLLSDFVKDPMSARRSSLKFPGQAYSMYNFSGLQNIETGYFLFSGRSLKEIFGNSTELTLASEDYSLLKLGSSEEPAFIEPATVLGLAADTGNSSITTSFAGNPFFLSEDIFGTTDFSPGGINVFNKINRIALIISGVKESFLRKRYKIKLGGIDISKKISKEPIRIGSGKLLFILDNITSVIDGVLPFVIEKNEKRFGSDYATSSYSGQFTAVVKNTNSTSFSIDDRTGILTLNVEISDSELIPNLGDFLTSQKTSGLLGNAENQTNLLDSIFPNSDTDGLIFDPTNTEQEITHKCFSNINVKSTASSSFKFNSQDLNEISSLLPEIAEGNVSELVRNYFVINNAGTFNSRSYLLNETKDTVLLFGNILLDGLASIKYNVPEVISIGEEEQEPIKLSSGNEIPITVGKKYKFLVKNTDRDFIIKLDDIVLKPRGRPESTSTPGEYIAIVEAPEALLVKDNCFVVCASTDNSTRNRAKLNLGRDFVIDLDEIYQDMLSGPLKDKIPDVQGLIDKLKDAPLRFASIVLDKANVPKDLIKSFCDFSFHLLAELKISLNGFQVLMIPIQVIFCIIDVICSLLNPVKIAKSVIRLFQCLYDLILLLPQISIPVMFLQLILHLLELLQCVIDKILFTITAINEIARAINLAAQKPINFTAIKSLEETLSEYLFEIEADLSFLEPILSILSIFLELLQLIFRFPCNINPAGGEADCGVDGTMLAGIVAGIAAPDLFVIPDVMLPIAQSYSTDSEEGSTSSPYLIEPTVGLVIANTVSGSYLNSMALDPDSLRGTNIGNDGVEFNATMAPAFTKTSKKAGNPTQVEFLFKGKGISTTLNSKNIEPNQTADSTLALFSNINGEIKISSFGNIYSPVDGEEFLNINTSEKTASVKPLIINIDVPVFTTDETTGIPVQTGTESVTRTFDNIPKLVIMDDEFNVYFIIQNGIEYDDDGFVSKITAEIVNASSAPKLKFSREDVELDTDNDSSTDDGTIQVFDFPQMYFFDMRQAADQLQQFCSTSSINSFPFEDNNVDDITNIISNSQNCLQDYLTLAKGLVSSVRDAQSAGSLPLVEIDIDKFSGANDDLISCLEGSADQICKYVVNSLNTSFKVIEDNTLSTSNEFVNGDIDEEILDGFDSIGPAFTGAREYAAGIGDNANIEVGKIAHIEIIPRDSYDKEIIGDLTERISIDIISDTTGSANLILENNNVVIKSGTSYIAKLTASKVGNVKLRARICDRTIQALTYSGLDTTNSASDVDCVPDNLTQAVSSSPPLGALTKVDRIITIYFVNSSQEGTFISSQGGGGDNIITDPQAFGSALEN